MKIDHPQIREFEYNYITDGIYIGTNQCCQTHFDEKLLKEGITVNISLEDDRLDSPFGVEFYVWIPVKNHNPLTDDQLEFGVSAIKKMVAMGKKIYVHCQNGHGRAPTLVAAYLVEKGSSLEEAEDFIKSKRPTIHLEDTQRASLQNFSRGLNNAK